MRRELGQLDNKVERFKTAARGFTRVISFTSGKGGVGKTHTTINVAIALAQQAKNVLVLDADLGLANIDVMLGIRPKFTLEHVLSGEKSLEEVMISGPAGISIIPATSGVESICNLSTEQRMMLMEAVESVAGNFDYLLIDTQAGIGPDVMYFNSASNEVICVINNEPTSLTDAYALIKVLATNYQEKSVSVVANNVPSAAEGRKAFDRLSKAVERFLHIEVNYLGHVIKDAAVYEALSAQRALMEVFPSSQAARDIGRLAEEIDTNFRDLRVKGGLQFFFRQLLEVGAHG